LGALIPAPRQASAIVAFFDEMRLSGFVEGQNLIVIPNGFDVSNDRLPENAAALVAAAPDVIISGPDHYARALQRATRTIPILAMSEDMLGAGLVSSLARPGGNMSGMLSGATAVGRSPSLPLTTA
jgi:putative ABC transport system substrate-binding protein